MSVAPTRMSSTAKQNGPMEFRRIRPEDTEEVYRFCVEGLRPRLYPLNFDPDKVRHTIRYFISQSITDFHLAAFEGPRMVGGIGAVVSEMFWFERCEATVVMFRAEKPGVGKKLIDALMTWVKRTPRVRRVTIPIEFDAPRAMERYLRMRGFTTLQRSAVAIH